jgi:hypothetical protein
MGLVQNLETHRAVPGNDYNCYIESLAASAACAARSRDAAAGWLVTVACEDELCSGWPGAALPAQVGLEWAKKAVRRVPCMGPLYPWR